MSRLPKALSAFCCTWALLLSEATASINREDFYRDTALKAAKLYRIQPTRHTYQPQSDPREVAASTIGIQGHVLLEAFRSDGDLRWLDAAVIAGRSIIAHGDMNGDGKVGWGRYWNLATPSGDDRGGNTTFVKGCDLPRTRAYDDELYDDARIAHFLIELSRTTKDGQYEDMAKRVIDDTWSYGKKIYGSGFSYFKTIGPCAKGWLVKNVNMLMAVPIALLSQKFGERYRKRASAMLFAENEEINRRVDGRRAPNFGYYAVQTVIDKSTLGQYVDAAQTRELKSEITCNLKTRSGESCIAHLGMEARALVLAARALGQSPSQYYQTAIDIMASADARDPQMCEADKTPNGAPRSDTGCVAYHCALRQLDARFDDRCFNWISQFGARTQDVILGLFWGAKTR